MITILLTAGIAASVDAIQDADAIKSQGTKIRKTGSAGSPVCGIQLCSEIEEIPEPKKEVKPTPAPKQEPKQELKTQPKSEPKTTPTPKTQTKQTMEKASSWQTSSGTITSSQDPGVGHETHQLAIILPPTSNV